ncbi:MAG: hypothetical protein U0271_47980 [Polyangiaceae bacterium]
MQNAFARSCAAPQITVVDNELLRSAALRIAADTGYDYRSVIAALEGRRVRRSTRTAVEGAARRLGLAHLLPDGHSIEPEQMALPQHDEPLPVE